MSKIFRQLVPAVCLFLLLGSDMDLFRWIVTAGTTWADSVSRKDAVPVIEGPIKISARRPAI